MAVALVAQLGSATPASAAPPSISRFTATVTDLNLITLEWQVSGAVSQIYISDVGFRNATCGTTVCSTTLRAGRGGVHRFTLSANNTAGETSAKTVETTVKVLPAPGALTGYRVDVDMFNRVDRALTWTVTGTGFVRVHPATGTDPTEYPRTGTRTVPGASLPTVGTATWGLQYCERVRSESPLCGPTTQVHYVVAPALITGTSRRFVDPGTAVDLAWTGGSGRFTVSAPTLNGFTASTTNRNLTIPGGNIVPGVHRVELISCTQTATPVCSNVVDLKATVAGAVRRTIQQNYDAAAGQSIGTVTPTGGTASPITVPAWRAGRVDWAVADGQQVAAGTIVARLRTADVGAVELVVGGRDPFTYRAWSTDYTAATYDTSDRPGTGDPLDVTIDSNGNAWQVDEFSSAVSQVTGTSLTHHEAPYAQAFANNMVEPVKPYLTNLFAPQQKTSKTELGERIIDTGRYVWFTHGGGLYNTGTGNHSRLIRFDRQGTDSPNTVADDRLCAVHVPGDRNEVVGIAYQPAFAGQPARIWFAESRASAGAGNAAIGSFIDNGYVPCTRDLNYNDPNAVKAANDANVTRCASTYKLGCITQTVLPTTTHPLSLLPQSPRAAHLAVDTDTNSLWITDKFGWFLTRLSLNDPTKTDIYPLPGRIREGGKFNGYPWQIRVDTNAVYFVEYTDNQLVRLDKNLALSPTGGCKALTGTTNPCIKELTLPAGLDVQAHSIALTSDKLWFTVAFDGRGPRNPNESHFGYVDLISWKNGAPTGVIYNGFTTLGTAKAGQSHSFRGIEVNAAGKVVLADAGYKEIAVLTKR